MSPNQVLTTMFSMHMSSVYSVLLKITVIIGCGYQLMPVLVDSSFGEEEEGWKVCKEGQSKDKAENARDG